jgi:hypothetical protein
MSEKVCSRLPNNPYALLYRIVVVEVLDLCSTPLCQRHLAGVKPFHFVQRNFIAALGLPRICGQLRH